jgi:protein-S-isoprenylcysteine O-methyltransferase Ste14
MKSLTARAIVYFVRRFVSLSLIIFVPAWSLDFWQAWVFLALFFILELQAIIYLLRNDPELLERRLKRGVSAENRPAQKAVIFLIAVFSGFLVVSCVYDHRLQWSHVPAILVITADVAIAIGYLIFYFVFKANRFASATIGIVAEQKVISTGPYAVVRHPMYSGAVLVNLFMPIALGSWWGLPFALALHALIVLRILDEEKLLRRDLPGYEDYSRKVRYRLIPGVW